ncbi:M42 family metallopeptidase [Lentisphaerota bacterium WC36G]|nr:M42 family metallopeptidase [Lentisphaerae bacterium WC36]
MFDDKSLKFLEDLLNSSSPSGYEMEAAKIFRDYVSEFADEVKTDVMGNTISVINPNAEFKVMLAGHYDEIGFQIVYISDEGLIYFRSNGGIDKLTVPGTEVVILTEKNGKIPGVIGKKPIHMLESSERDKAIELHDSWIDIGVDSKEEALELVAIGDPIAVKSNFLMMNENRVMSKGMDDKIGAFVVAEVMRALSKRSVKVGVYGVGTVQEEVGLRGATTSAFAINPSVGIAIDVGFTTDIPDIPKKRIGEIKLGDGPKLTKSADNNIVLGKIIRETATKHELAYQESVGHRASGGTDTATIQLTQAGVACALISVPNRYMHSPVEICDLRDALGAVRIITETICAFTGDESFIPGID